MHRLIAIGASILGVVTCCLVTTTQRANSNASPVTRKCSCIERIDYLQRQSYEARTRHDLLGSAAAHENSAIQRLSCLKRGTIKGHPADVLVEAADDYLDAGMDEHYGGNQSKSVRLLSESLALANRVLLPDKTKSSVASHIIETATSFLDGKWAPASVQYDLLPNYPKVRVCTQSS